MPAHATTTRRSKCKAHIAAWLTLLCAGAAQAQSFSAAPVIFPATGDNAPPAQQVKVTLTAPSTVRSIAIPLPLAAVPEFILVDNGGCVEDGTTVNASGAVCSLVVRFHPQYAGMRTATLVVTDGAGRSVAVPISGTGYYPQITVLPAATRIVAGLGPSSAAATGDGDAAVLATLNAPHGVVSDSFGNLYIADTGNNIVRMLDAFGNITTVAGGGTMSGAAADGGLATAASLASPSWLAVDAAGNLYIAETGSHVVRRVAMSSSRVITTVAGSYLAGASGDGGPATAARLNAPTGLAIDTAGNLYIADAGNFRIRRVDAATGNIIAFAGTGTGGFNASSTPAASAQFSTLAGLALDTVGNLFIADEGNHAVREVAGGNVIVVAGTGVAGSSADGTSALSASLGDPEGVAVTPSGDVYFTDATAGLVRKVRAANGTLETVIATAGRSNGFTPGVRPSNDVSLHTPLGLAFDSRFTLFVADSANNVLRALSPTPGELNFAAQSVGNTSSSMAVHIENIGNAGLSFAGVTAADNTTSANFTLNTATADACATTLDAAALCSFTLAFSPQASGSVTGKFNVGYHSPSNSVINLSAPVLVSGGTLASLAISPGSLSAVSQGQAASLGITATGYFGTVALDTEGALPPGITANISGAVLTLSGTPSAAGTFPFTVFATDSLGATAAQAYALQVLPVALALNVAETVHVADTALPLLSIALTVSEAIHVVDTPKQALSVLLAVNEAIHVTDTPKQLVSLALRVNEVIHVVDTSRELLPAVLAVTEAIHVIDTPTQALSLLLKVNEAVHVTDTPKETSSLLLNVAELIHVTDLPKELLPAVLAVVESIHVTDTPKKTLSLLLQVAESIHVLDAFAPLTQRTLAISETIHVADAASERLSQTVTSSVPSVTISSGISPTNLSATFSFTGSTAPTGAVAFTVDNGQTVAGSCTVSGSARTCTVGYATASLAVGTHTVTATEAGDSIYSAASATGSLTVTAGQPSLTTASSLSATGNGYVVTVTVTNTGNGPAQAVTVTGVTVGTVTGTPVPQSMGTLAAGSSASASFQVPSSAGPAGSTVVGKVTGTYTGGSFGASLRMRLPSQSTN